MARIASGLAAALAALCAASAAEAADLPYKAQPAQYMKACIAEGEGFFYIPGTDTCLRIGGYAWAEGYYNTYTDYPSQNAKLYSVATAGLILDARTATEYGTLRSYIETRFKWRTADPYSPGLAGNEVELWNAYIQFAGFTFGHAQSFFDFYANANVLGTDPATIGDDVRINLIAYTKEFGNGFSATLSLEDAGDRLSGVPSWLEYRATEYEDYTSGLTAPDVVGNINYQGEWGTAQISGALHRTGALDGLYLGNTTEKWGYAIQGGVMFNLTALGEGDTFYLQSAYTSGATAYLGLQDPTGSYLAPDAFIGVNNGLDMVSGWNLTASLLHNWTEKWNTAVFGGYAAYDYNSYLAQQLYGASGGENYNVGGNITFTPVKNFSVSLQYDYTYNKAKDYVPTDFSAPLESTDASQVLLMMNRTF